MSINSKIYDILHCVSGWMEGLGFNLCVVPADRLGPSIS